MNLLAKNAAKNGHTNVPDEVLDQAERIALHRGYSSLIAERIRILMELYYRYGGDTEQFRTQSFRVIHMREAMTVPERVELRALFELVLHRLETRSPQTHP